MMNDLLVGCCGWQEARARYFAEFPVIELQDTFYQPPPVELARKWRQEAPAQFRFTMKAWQLITHRASSPTYRKLKQALPEERRAACGGFQPTAEVAAAWQRTLEVARALQAEVIVFQCPASFSPADENLRNLETFFSGIERGPYLLAWEPRGLWKAGVVRELCDRLGLVHGVDVLQSEPVTGGVFYFRLHGVGGYRYRYSEAELEELQRRVLARRTGGYVFFNNTGMLEDARRFQQRLR